MYQNLNFGPYVWSFTSQSLHSHHYTPIVGAQDNLLWQKPNMLNNWATKTCNEWENNEGFNDSILIVLVSISNIEFKFKSFGIFDTTYYSFLIEDWRFVSV